MLEGNSKNAWADQELLPFEVGYLPEFFQLKSEMELNETPHNKHDGLLRIKELTENDTDMNGINIDDDFLVQFLRCEKYNVTAAFSRLQSLIKLKESHVEMFSNFSFNITVKTVTDDIVTFLPWRCQDGCAILHINLDNWFPEDFPVLEVKRMVVVLLLQALQDPMNQVNGFKVIVNAKSNPLRHLRHCTLRNMYLIYHGTQVFEIRFEEEDVSKKVCAPAQFHALHLVNQSMTSRLAIKLIRPFLSEQLKRKILYHSSAEELLDYFPRSSIPTTYGGDLNDYDMRDWLWKVMQPHRLATMGGRNIKL